MKTFTSEMHRGKKLVPPSFNYDDSELMLGTSINCLQICTLLIFSNLWRTTSEEKRELERLQKPIYNSVRRAAEVHRQVWHEPVSDKFAA